MKVSIGFGAAVKLVLVFGLCFGQRRNPGFIMQIPRKGLNFLSKHSHDSVGNFLKKPQKFDFRGNIGPDIDFKLDNLQIKKFEPNFRSGLQLQPGLGMDWRITDLTLDTESHYEATFNRAKTSGTLLMKIYRMAVILILSAEERRSRLVPILEDCQVYIGIVDLQMEGNTIDEALFGLQRDLNRLAKNFLQRNLCRELQNHLWPEISEKFLSVPIASHLFDNYYINYGLTTQPKFGDTLITTEHNGGTYVTVRGEDGKTAVMNNTQFPFPVPEIEAQNKVDKMLYLYMSNYTVGTLVYWMNRFGRFNYEFSKEKSDKSFATYLRTECPESDLCAGSLFPALAKRFPNSSMEVTVKALTAPKTTIEKNGLISEAIGQIDGFARTPSGSLTQFITTKIRFVVALKDLKIEDYVLKGGFDFESYELFNIESDIESIDEPSMNFLIEIILDSVVKPDLMKSLKNGIKLPKLLDFEMTNGSIEYQKGMIVISSDFCKDDCPIKVEKNSTNAERVDGDDYNYNY